MANAFRKGVYLDGLTGTTLGNGEYGNLGAMIGALLLDRESRSVILDVDPLHGSLQEPFLRVIRVMKSLEFKLKSLSSFVKFTSNLHELIGQAPYELPDVFSFFLPEYSPKGTSGKRPPCFLRFEISLTLELLNTVGPISRSGLVCPECGVQTGPSIVDLMNGILSLLKYGLDFEYGGFSGWSDYRWKGKSRQIGSHLYSIGYNAYKPSAGLTIPGMIDELATLLTSGRLSRSKRDLMQSVAETYSGAEQYINIQQMIATSPEFHTTGVGRGTGDKREEVQMPNPSTEPYRAVVNIMLSGGWDSFNVLVPASCHGANGLGETVDQQYQSIRGELALTESEMSQTILVDASLGQPCSTFAIHPDAKIFKELYDEGSLSFFANAGVINSAKMNKNNYKQYTVSTLFAHNTMRDEARRVDPFSVEYGTGIMGRMSKVLEEKGYRTSGISIDNPSSILDGSAKTPLVVSRFGSTKFNDRPASENGFPLLDLAKNLNGQAEPYSSLFGETWSEELLSGVFNANFYADSLKKTSLSSDSWTRGSKLAQSLGMTARLMQTRDDRGIDRDMFYTFHNHWDHHAEMKSNLSYMLKELDSALRGFMNEMKSQGLWDRVTIVLTSDFGRTLTMNGREGSDHAWGGHYVVLGGGVKGGRILGQYPNDLTEAGPYTVGRGRFMPTLSWDSIWSGVSEWMGVDDPGDLEYVLPNLHNTHGGDFFGPFTKADMFTEDTSGNTDPSSNLFAH